MLGLGVLVGMSAMVVDVGQIVVERRQLQNGADGSALALAQRCAYGLAKCTSDASNLTPLSNGSSQDSKSGVSVICGYAYKTTGSVLPSCSSVAGATVLQGSKVDCSALSGQYLQYARIYTETLTTSGSKILRWLFARAIPGNSGQVGTTMHACGQAWWGGRSTADVSLPIAISMCNFNNLGVEAVTDACQGSSTLDGAPIAQTHSSSLGVSCYTGDANCTLPAASHWTRATACAPHPFKVNDVLSYLSNGDLTASSKYPCTDEPDQTQCPNWTSATSVTYNTMSGLAAALCKNLGKDNLIPVFEVVDGNSKTVVIRTFAMYHLTGFTTGGAAGTKASVAYRNWSSTNCPDLCLSGYFVRSTSNNDYSTNPGTVPNLGYQTLRLVP